jgi:hypothetical protein
VRRWAFPRAALVIAARGVCNPLMEGQPTALKPLIQTTKGEITFSVLYGIFSVFIIQIPFYNRNFAAQISTN